MAGILPDGGVPPSQTINALQNGDYQDGCEPLFYDGRKCNLRVSAASLNALLSEIVNLVNCAGLQYDCNQLDNLCDAVAKIAADMQCLLDIVDEPDLDDTVSGCFDGSPGSATIESILALNPTQVWQCLPGVNVGGNTGDTDDVNVGTVDGTYIVFTANDNIISGSTDDKTMRVRWNDGSQWNDIATFFVPYPQRGQFSMTYYQGAFWTGKMPNLGTQISPASNFNGRVSFIINDGSGGSNETIKSEICTLLDGGN